MIVPVTEGLLPQVLAIEESAFSAPWSEGSFTREAGIHDADFEAFTESGRVLGYYVLHQAGDEGELYKIAVAGSARRRGIGDALLSRAEERARARGLARIFLEVRAGNGAAVALYEKHGFRRLGVRRRYYTAPVEDAVIMAKEWEESGC